MNYNDITVGIVSFKSQKVLFDCLKSIKYIKNIIIFDNSNDLQTKKKIENIYPKIKFILSKSNIGYGCANNRIINKCKSKYLFILNPDTILKKNCENELLKSIKLLKENFSIISPVANEKNYGVYLKTNKKYKKKNLIKVDYVKGFAMLINKKKIKNIGMFDNKIFLYLEEIDLCKRLIQNNHKIFLCKKAKILHKGAKSTDLGFEFEKCRNWHWMWSNFYFQKKYSNYINAFLNYLPTAILYFLKTIIYFIILKDKKSKIYYYRLSGILNAIIGRKSWFRPNINF